MLPILLLTRSKTLIFTCVTPFAVPAQAAERSQGTALTTIKVHMEATGTVLDFYISSAGTLLLDLSLLH
jgi:hypothetical protein